MTNDELLAKLLDNSLTESEQQVLSARMAASPQFAEEVREFLAVEGVLQKTKPALQPHIPTHLMNSVETIVASSIAAGRATAANQMAKSPVLSPRFIGKLSAVLISASILWYLLPGSNDKPAPAESNQPTAYEQQPSAHAAPELITPEPIAESVPAQQREIAVPVQREQPDAQSTAPRTRHAQADPAQESVAQTTNEKQSLEMAAETQKSKLRSELASSMDEYDRYRAAGDAVNTMLKATDIALFQIRLEDFESSRLYLDEALILARQLKLEEDEATILGHIGLLEEARGARQHAVQLIEECVDKLRSLHSPALQRWQDELRRIKAK